MPTTSDEPKVGRWIGEDTYINIVSDFSSDIAESRIPYEFALFELQMEWGLTDEEFDSIDEEKIQKIMEYRNAKNIGENAKQKS